MSYFEFIYSWTEIFNYAQKMLVKVNIDSGILPNDGINLSGKKSRKDKYDFTSNFDEQSSYQ